MSHNSSNTFDQYGTGTVDLTRRTMEIRQGTNKNYFPRINPMNNEAMMDLRRDGNCTILDPRACIHLHDNGADVACCMYLYISHLYFDAMVMKGYIPNHFALWLHCTEKDTYLYVTAENRVSRNSLLQPTTVESMVNKVMNRNKLCHTGADLLKLNQYDFIHKQPMKRSRDTEDDRPRNLQVLNAKAFRYLVRKDKDKYDCKRDIERERVSRNVTACSTRKVDSKAMAMRNVVPTLIVEAEWGLVATYDADHFGDFMS